jgi:transposase-like protein
LNGSCDTTNNQTIGEATMGEDAPAALGALRVDEGKLRGHVDQLVRSSVEETLNALLDAEADEICRAQRNERSADRVDTRAGHYERKLETKAGEVRLKIRSSGACRLRQRSSSVTGGARRRWKKRWWRCI